MPWWWLIYLLLGLFVGFFAGLLGIGGGIIIVTVLVFTFGLQQFPADRLLHLALGTSLASIVFTSLSTIRAHHAHRAVRWDILKQATPGVVIGTIVGALFADALPSRYLALFFTGFVFLSGVQMWLGLEPKPTRQLPGVLGMTVAGLAVGGICSLVGAGGGVITIPLMTLCNVSMRNAIGTSAALGLPVAVAGAVGYVLTGLTKDHLPALSVGYVYLPALFGIVVGTFVTVPLGARMTHAMPVSTLRRIFAVILFVMAVKMATSLF